MKRNGLTTDNQIIMNVIASLHKKDRHHIYYSEFLAACFNEKYIFKNTYLKQIYNYIKSSKKYLEIIDINEIYINHGHSFDVGLFEDILQDCKITLKYQNGLTFEEFYIIMNKKPD